MNQSLNQTQDQKRQCGRTAYILLRLRLRILARSRTTS